MNSSFRQGFVVVPAIVLASGLLAGCPPRSGPIKMAPTDQKYQQMVDAFYTGVAALNVGSVDVARENLTNATRLVPDEPAAWANLALFSVRNQDFSNAEKALKEARQRGGESGELELTAGLLARGQGKPSEALTHFKRAAELKPEDVRVQWMLVEELNRQAVPGTEAEVITRLQKILEVRPENLYAQLELLRLAAKTGNAEVFRKMLAGLKAQSAAFPPEATARIPSLESAGNLQAVLGQTMLFSNLLRQMPRYPQHSAELGVGSTAPGVVLEGFLRLPHPSPAPAAPDTGVTFSGEPLAPEKASWARLLDVSPAAPPEKLDEPESADPEPVLVTGSAASVLIHSKPAVTLPLRGTTGADGVLFADWNNDFRMDVLLAGSGGARLFQQAGPGKFTDITAKTGIPPASLKGPFLNAWAFEVDLDGDLDLVLGTGSGVPTVLRNNGDGTFTLTRPFPGISGTRTFTWADLDADGDSDVALTDGAGMLHVFNNQRAGYYTPVAVPEDLGKVFALSTADANHDGTLELVLLANGASIRRLSLRDPQQGEWDPSEIATWQDAPSDWSARLEWGDLDNNGAPDLVASGSQGTQAWLADATGALQALAPIADARIFSVIDANSDGRLDLIGLTSVGVPGRWVNKGTRSYNWQVLRPRGAPNVKDNSGNQKLNSFAWGGEVEVRAGLLYAKQPLDRPRLHFGLGDYRKSNVVRVTWPNGRPQAEFGVAANQAPMAKQRLEGSCPWLFAWNGKAVEFVTDILWKSPLGLRINAQQTAGVSQTLDWVKVRGDQVQPREGFYDFRVTAELWETDIFDHVSLMVVDHPKVTEIFVDERFSIPQPPLELIPTTEVKPVARALDEQGTDVTDLVSERDLRHLDTFPLGRFQGVAQDHYVEIELPPGAPRKDLLLVAYGWVFPTDSSINVAIGQGRHPAPKGLSIEVPDGSGGWRLARAGQGFPAGKNKHVVLRLDGLFPTQAAVRKLRLRTNLEVYWDFLGHARELPTTRLKTTTIAPATAELRYRGFSYLSQEKRSSPELPDYNLVTQTGQVWLDLVGYYTRFGDVRELLEKVEDRYVLMNAGDELALRFPALAAPSEGFVRDYVFVSDGWDKDGNFNTGFSTTLLPLPSHADTAYDKPPVPLTQDPVYRRFPKDWEQYHTRYVSVRPFKGALLPGTRPR
jgi:Tfp pilus assembly protein PilF